MEDIFGKLYEMTAFSNIIADPQFLIMYAIAFILLYLGIKKRYEPLLLVPIAFGVLLANFPGGEMGVTQADENGMIMINGTISMMTVLSIRDGFTITVTGIILIMTAQCMLVGFMMAITGILQINILKIMR